MRSKESHFTCCLPRRDTAFMMLIFWCVVQAVSFFFCHCFVRFINMICLFVCLSVFLPFFVICLFYCVYLFLVYSAFQFSASVSLSLSVSLLSPFFMLFAFFFRSTLLSFLYHFSFFPSLSSIFCCFPIPPSLSVSASVSLCLSPSLFLSLSLCLSLQSCALLSLSLSFSLTLTPSSIGRLLSSLPHFLSYLSLSLLLSA